jgi:hypothetical protein
MEKITNAPKQITIGLKDGKQETIELHEPPMGEFLEFMEMSIGKLSAGYAKNMTIFNRIASSGEVGLVDVQIFKPAFEPVCDFLAVCARRPDLKGWIHENITVVQFIECINAMLYLIDIQNLYENFTQALERIASVKKSRK